MRFRNIRSMFGSNKSVIKNIIQSMINTFEDPYSTKIKYHIDVYFDKINTRVLIGRDSLHPILSLRHTKGISSIRCLRIDTFKVTELTDTKGFEDSIKDMIISDIKTKVLSSIEE